MVENFSLKKFIALIDDGLEQQYVGEIIRNIDQVLFYLCSYNDKELRRKVRELSLVFQFYTKQTFLKTKMIDEIRKICSGAGFSGQLTCSRIKKIDILLYWQFELAECKEEYWDDTFPLEVKEVFSNLYKLPLFVSSLRRSFAKAIAIFDGDGDRDEEIIKSLEKTATNEGIELLVLWFVFAKESHCPSNEIQFIESLNALPEKSLVRLAKDLRRVTIEESKNLACYDGELLSLVFKDHNSKNRFLEKTLVLAYAGRLKASSLNWIRKNIPELQLAKKEYEILCSLLGYDSMVAITTIEKLASCDITLGIPAASGSTSIESYFSSCLSYWAKKANSSIRDVNFPLVSIIFSVHDPRLALLQLSVRSIVLQSYPNIEIIFIDDCSDVDVANDIEAIVSRECVLGGRKLKYIRNNINKGQYRNRNTGIRRSDGEFIGIQDDDDISHPDRISRQVNAMISSEKILASHVKHIRISENSRLMLDGDNIGDPYGDAPPSFIWKRSVFERIGDFIPSKTRGDVEFYQRMKSSLGHDVIIQVDAPLLLMRGALTTVSSQREYWSKGALEAQRYIMNNVDLKQRFLEGKNLSRYIPAVLS